MALFNKDYGKDLQNIDVLGEKYENYAEYDSSRISSIIKDTYALLTASMVAAAAGAFVAMNTGISLATSPLIYLVVIFGLILGMQFAVSRGANTLALVLLFAFTFITGMTVGAIISLYVSMGAGHVVTQAFVATAVAFGALTIYAMRTKADFSSWTKPLFWTLIGVVVVSLLNVFLFKSGILALGVSAVCAVLFSAYILFDTQKIIRGEYTSPVMAAVGMYLNIYNLFMSLLHILGVVNRD